MPQGMGALNERMGIELVEVAAERVVATMPVEGNTQPYGLLHGGASVVLAETLGLGRLGAARRPGPAVASASTSTPPTTARPPRARSPASRPPIHLGRTHGDLRGRDHRRAGPAGSAPRGSPARCCRRERFALSRRLSRAARARPASCWRRRRPARGEHLPECSCRSRTGDRGPHRRGPLDGSLAPQLRASVADPQDGARAERRAGPGTGWRRGSSAATAVATWPMPSSSAQVDRGLHQRLADAVAPELGHDVQVARVHGTGSRLTAGDRRGR